MSATYSKLRDGSWGLRIAGRVAPGEQVTVTKRSGETRTETVRHIIWQAPDGSVTLAAIQKGGAAPRTNRATYGRGYRGDSSYTCDECGEHATPGTRCWETGMAH
ncbi:MAG: hypothetical protein EBS89_08700 [Proteobacteria bacterium]|nr:hypothetical protein [Pseudomonadota bacterium]